MMRTALTRWPRPTLLVHGELSSMLAARQAGQLVALAVRGHLRSRNVRLLVTGQSLSMLSYGAYFTVLAWFAYDTGGGPGAAGVVLGAVALSSVATLFARRRAG